VPNYDVYEEFLGVELCSDESPVVGECKLEDPNATRACIKKLVDAITTLQQHHVAHCNALRNTNRPGSK
jgi:hypothetical protein